VTRPLTDTIIPDGQDQLAAEAVTVAQLLTGLVRDVDRHAIGVFIGSLELTGQRVTALLVMLASMVDPDKPPTELLSWMTWVDWETPIRRQSPGAWPAVPWQEHRTYEVPLRSAS
jgi:hypothetical protein